MKNKRVFRDLLAAEWKKMRRSGTNGTGLRSEENEKQKTKKTRDSGMCACGTPTKANKRGVF